MGDRENKILAKARVTLNDLGSSPRWSDETLMGLLSDGQDDMCKSIPMIARKATINTSIGQEEYRLPSDSVKLLSARSNGIPLTITSYDEIERDNAEWETDTGSYTNVIVNALSQQVIRPYPLPSDESEKAIKVRYQAMPIRLGWENDDSLEELAIDTMWDFGLRQYVIAMAFVDYGDESSLSRSQIAMGLYNKEYTRASKLAQKSFAKRALTTGYQAKVVNTRYLGRYDGRSSRRRY